MFVKMVRGCGEMTECERLVKEGVVSEDFIKPEVRCGFEVTTERKKIWAIELDLLREFDAVCKQQGLRYFLSGGSTLGAVRHHGYIPWDDDIDINMFREDYNKLLTLWDCFSGRYYLQMPGKDKGYYYSFAKLRNSQTTCVCRHLAHAGFNQGIFIDIFPMDVIDGEHYRRVYPEIKRLNIENSTYMRKSNPCPTEEDKERIRSHSGIDPLEALEKIDKLVFSCKLPNSGLCASATETIYPVEKKLWPTTDFNTANEVDFEMMRVPIPCGYNDILMISFGDYMQLPPKDKRGDWHSYYEFDPDRPYKQVLMEKYGVA